MEKIKKNEVEETTNELLANIKDDNSINNKENENIKNIPQKEEINKKNKIFEKYKIRDVVFLAIMTACTLITGAIMPLLVNVPVFGIIQLGLGIQFSLFPVIGMMKVKKPGCLLFQSIFISLFLIFMFPPMAMLMICALICEILVLVIFRGYKNDWASVLAGTFYMPLTIPFLFMYYRCFYTVTGSEKSAVSMFIGDSNWWVILLISLAVIALCFVGSVIGMIISRELKKAGVLKK